MSTFFPWRYHACEMCCFLDGQVTVTPGGGEPVTMGKGDLAVLPTGMSCMWDIHAAVKKRHRFG